MGRGRTIVNFVATAACAGAVLRAGAGTALAGDATPARERFVVRPFVNGGGPPARTLDHLATGLPALVAERLARHPGLRFAGGPALLSLDSRFDDDLLVVSGTFTRRPDWKIEVEVEIARAGQKVAEAQAVGGKDAASATAIEAALEAFDLAGRPAPLAVRSEARKPFGRDPYAFVLYGRGIAAFRGLDGRPPSADRAALVLGRSLVIDPRVPETRRYLGHVHLLAGRPGHARTMWLYALDLRPDYGLALQALAALDRTDKLPSARERYAKLCELDPADLDARRVYGEILADAGALPEAERELQQVVAQNPGDLRARRALALVLASRHAGEELAKELAEVVRLDPDDLDARFELGAALAAVGRVDDAVAAYDEILRRRPRHAVALKLSADLHLRRGDLGKAAAYYDKLRRLQPDDPRPVFLLGTAYYQAGKLAEAERMFLEGMRYPGMLGDAYGNLGAIALRRGHQREAVWFLSRAAQRRPGKAGVRYNHALALDRAERRDEALGELGAAAAADPQDAGVRYAMALVQLRLGRLADAAESLRETLRLDPDHADAKHNLALLEALTAPKAEGGVTLKSGLE